MTTALLAVTVHKSKGTISSIWSASFICYQTISKKVFNWTTNTNQMQPHHNLCFFSTTIRVLQPCNSYFAEADRPCMSLNWNKQTTSKKNKQILKWYNWVKGIIQKKLKIWKFKITPYLFNSNNKMRIIIITIIKNNNNNNNKAHLIHATMIQGQEVEVESFSGH